MSLQTSLYICICKGPRYNHLKFICDNEFILTIFQSSPWDAGSRVFATLLPALPDFTFVCMLRKSISNDYDYRVAVLKLYLLSTISAELSKPQLDHNSTQPNITETQC